MSTSRWVYDPDICDGNPCINDCDSCSLKELINIELEKDTESEDSL